MTPLSTSPENDRLLDVSLAPLSLLGTLRVFSYARLSDGRGIVPVESKLLWVIRILVLVPDFDTDAGGRTFKDDVGFEVSKIVA